MNEPIPKTLLGRSRVLPTVSPATITTRLTRWCLRLRLNIELAPNNPNPIMLQQFRGARPFDWILLEAPLQKVNTLITELIARW